MTKALAVEAAAARTARVAATDFMMTMRDGEVESKGSGVGILAVDGC